MVGKRAIIAHMPSRSIWFAILLSVLIAAGCSGTHHSPTANKPSQSVSVRKLEPPLLPTKAPHWVTDIGCHKRKGTTVGLEACSLSHVYRLDRKANRLIRLIWLRLVVPGDEAVPGGVINTSAGRRSFVEGERAWRIYSEDQCTTRAREYLGGTAAGPARDWCMEDLTKAHIRDLKKTADLLAPH